MGDEVTQVGMTVDERWPTYLLLEAGHTYADFDVDVPDDQLKRWCKVNAEFDAVQDEMRDLYDAARAAVTA